ncbi:hypothetical protein QTO34_007945 [Cnephaeus nilssonii]|uniref:Uncharacterized protein n=1 Tax=Cnephaeus nilssonii TaxID=3371016 RepID=A0AA40I9F2_CNENI|nr:hypothetical protein QTO34_007945 [Eptesicus nilssonii]
MPLSKKRQPLEQPAQSEEQQQRAASPDPRSSSHMSSPPHPRSSSLVISPPPPRNSSCASILPHQPEHPPEEPLRNEEQLLLRLLEEQPQPKEPLTPKEQPLHNSTFRSVGAQRKGHGEKMAIYKPETEPLSKTKSADILILDFWPPELPALPKKAMFSSSIRITQPNGEKPAEFETHIS